LEKYRRDGFSSNNAPCDISKKPYREFENRLEVFARKYTGGTHNND
jgi:hypothetical protein